jgi:hypothetical protein
VRGRETAASRAKAATLKTLKRDLGKEKIGHLDRQKLIDVRLDARRSRVRRVLQIGLGDRFER